MSATDPAEVEQPFISHLIELRDRLLRMVIAIAAAFIVLFPFGNDIYTFVADPLMSVLPEGTSMIATQVASPFLTPFKLSLMAAVFIVMPFILYQMWGFIAPGLYQHERKMVIPLLASSVFLFYLGIAFAYFVVFPLVFAFLTSVAPEGVAVMTDINAYLDFVLTLFFAFGISFEVPIATIILVWMGMTTPQKMAAKRPYVIVGAFVIGMLMTPPDVISQSLLAIPVWLLFEVGVIASKGFVRQKDEDEEDGEDSATETDSAAADEPESDVPRWVPMTEDEMDAELDAIEADEDEPTESDDDINPVDAKLHEVRKLRDDMRFDEARALLQEVLQDGDESQKQVARNILAQLDD